jgi:hypothetical protein
LSCHPKYFDVGSRGAPCRTSPFFGPKSLASLSGLLSRRHRAASSSPALCPFSSTTAPAPPPTAPLDSPRHHETL